MPENVFYQWQNEHLLKVIYPTRTLKLVEFLVYVFEIEVWKKYKGRSAGEFPQEVADYCAGQQQLIRQGEQRLRDLERYVQTPDVRADPEFQARFPAPEPAALEEINKAHRLYKHFYPRFKSADQVRFFTTSQIRLLEALDPPLRRALGSLQRNVAVPNLTPGFMAMLQRNLAQTELALEMLAFEIGQLKTFLTAFERLARYRLALDQAKAQRPGIPQTGSDLDQMLNLVDPAAVTVADLARSSAEKYRDRLDLMTQEQLIEEIAALFMADPQAYPLWLQYMVIHFSGMRYQSAHGSWADPKELLLALRCKKVEEDVRALQKAGLVEAACAARFAGYHAAVDGAARPPEDDAVGLVELPALALAEEPTWQDKARYHLRRIAPNSGYFPFRALLDLCMDEENYDTSRLSDEQALEELRGLKVDLPDWMWREIVKMTELRTTEVNRPDWERLTAEERAARDDARSARFREVLENWKSKNITGWRQQHDRTHRLIVTRAVCNEVAEHIQHIRGHSPAGGLTAKPGWYIARAADPKLAGVLPRPFFARIRGQKNLKVGASIFWLDWVHQQPNQWQIARPMAPPGEPDLIELGRDENHEVLNRGSHYVRHYRRTQIVNGQPQLETGLQWLRWLHEATIAVIGETADGPTVLTFETALPHEDRRQSAVGIFKRRAEHLNYRVNPSLMIGTYTGFVPEVGLPEAEQQTLAEMMDWNKILRREAFTPAQIEAYWRAVTVPRPPASFSLDAVPEEEFQVEVAPELRVGQDVETALCYPRADGSMEGSLYTLPVRLPRGMRLTVAASVDAAGACLRVVECPGEPLAQDLYLRPQDVIRLPDGPSSRPVITRRDVRLYRLCGAEKRRRMAAGRTPTGSLGPEGVEIRPVFEPAARRLLRGVRASVSTVHNIGAGEGGVVIGPRLRQYVLIVRCPLQPGAEGLFVSKRDILLLLRQ